MEKQLDLTNVKDFILAGHAIVTFKSLVTGNHFTYRIVKHDEQINGCDVYWISLLTGQDNTNDYTYMGMVQAWTVKSRKGIEKIEYGYRFTLTKKSRISENAPSYKAFKRVFEDLFWNEKIDPRIEIYHEGRCGRCGRVLSTPESVELGIGPECIKKLGLVE